MALTGKDKYKVRQLLQSGDQDKITQAYYILKENGYTDREISNWIDTMLSVKKHEARRKFDKVFNAQSSNHKDWPPTFMIGPEHKEQLEEAIKELYGDQIVEDES